MNSRSDTAGWALLAMAAASVLLGAPQAGLLLALAAGALALLAPSTEARDSRRRNQARPAGWRR